MALGAVLKNLYSFLEVLQAAKSDKVADWDAHSIQNALKWASFAQQIYTQSKGKPYSSQLDHEVKKLGQLPWHLGNFVINLSGLEHSRKHLVQCLLQNPHLKPELVSSLQQHVAGREFLELSDELLSTTTLANVLVDYKTNLDMDSLEGSVPSLSTQCEAHLLLQYLQTHLSDIDDISRVSCLLANKLSTFASCSHGIAVVVVALVTLSMSDITPVSVSLHDLLLKCLREHIKEVESVLWELPSSLLVNLCRFDSDLLPFYLEYITHCGSSLQPDYTNFRHNLRIMWRSNSKNSSASYEILKCRICDLCNSSSNHVVVTTKCALENLITASQSEPNVWKELMSDIASER